MRVPESSVEHPHGSSSTPIEWQFSLRSLFVVTSVLSVFLAVGTYFAGFMFAVATIVLIQTATLLAGDWLIRPANRRALAFVTTGSWVILGSGLAIIAFSQTYGAIVENERGSFRWSLAIFLTIASAICYYTAARRWRSLTTHRRANL